MILPPENIQLIGEEIAFLWGNGEEDYFPQHVLREKSPSAENVGETDIMGNHYGGDGTERFPGVSIIGWKFVGNYAIRLEFSDGHNTGIYSWQYLQSLRENER